MLRNITIAKIKELNTKPRSVTSSSYYSLFPNCKYWDKFYSAPYGSVTQRTISKDKPLCFVGNALIASKGDYTVTNAVYDFETEEYSKGNTVKKALAVLGKQNDATYSYDAIFVIETGSTSSITINLMSIPFSFYYNLETSYGGVTIKTSYGTKSVISTKKSGTMEIGFISNGEYDDKGGSSTSYYIQGVSSYHSTRSTSVSIPDKYEVSVQTDSGYTSTYSKSGYITDTTRIYGYLSSYGDFDIQANDKSYSIKATCSISFGDKADTSKRATDISEDDWAFPEITATLSTQGGIFTEDNIDTTFPAEEEEDKGLSAGAIVGIVIGCIVVVGIIGFCVYWFVFRKNTNDANDQEEAKQTP